jgi:hypothetical protein
MYGLELFDLTLDREILIRDPFITYTSLAWLSTATDRLLPAQKKKRHIPGLGRKKTLDRLSNKTKGSLPSRKTAICQ